MVYQWKDASRIKADAQKAGAVFEHLESTVGLTARTLLDASRPKDAVLHREFEWNDSKAAEKYREDQARHIIRSLCVKPVEESQEPVRAYFKVSSSQPYSSIVTIQADSEKMSSLLDIAKSELVAFQSKYNTLKELKPVFDAIKEVV